MENQEYIENIVNQLITVSEQLYELLAAENQATSFGERLQLFKLNLHTKHQLLHNYYQLTEHYQCTFQGLKHQMSAEAFAAIETALRPKLTYLAELTANFYQAAATNHNHIAVSYITNNTIVEAIIDTVQQSTDNKIGYNQSGARVNNHTNPSPGIITKTI